MARPKAKSRSRPDAAEHPRVGRALLVLALVLAWSFVAASLWSYAPADPPGACVWPPNDPVSNLCGPVGAALAHYTLTFFGPGLWMLMALGGCWLGVAASGRDVHQPLLRSSGALMLALAVSGFAALLGLGGPQPQGPGGLLAITGVDILTARFHGFGAGVWLLLMGLIGVVVVFDTWALLGPRLAALALYDRVVWPAWDRVVRLVARLGSVTAQSFTARVQARRERRTQRRMDRVRVNDLDDDDRLERVRSQRAAFDRVGLDDPAAATEAEDSGDECAQAGAESKAPAPAAAEEETFDPESLREKIAKLPVRFAAGGGPSDKASDLSDIQPADADIEGYKFPGLDLLAEAEGNYSDTMESFVREQAERLEEAMRLYGVNGEVVGIDTGPVVTMYEVRLAPGTKVSKVQAVSSDVARSIRAVNIRIVANIAGRDTIGIEAPNATKEKVRIRELMTGGLRRGEVSKMALPMFLGKDASGDPLIEDLAGLPHMLIAGTTGSGKSVCLSTIIMSFLYTKKPNELKLVLVDPKMVELSAFRDIPHLMCPVVTEMGKATAILEWAVAKMDERYTLLAEARVRDIRSYNALSWEDLKERLDPPTEQAEARIPRKLPYIVFVIDELADLMMTNKEVEGSIVRIAQKARAVGMHLILATQRPQANVVTGLIKSNMPGRACFKVASGMDSRIILDQKGGEILLGQGDMLYLSPRNHTLERCQGTLVDDAETRRVVRFLKDVAAPSFERQLVQLKGDGADHDDFDTGDGLANAQQDPLFDKAVEVVLQTKRGSVSLLQRRLAIGYTRSSRLIDLMGESGIIGEYKGTVAREVMITPAEWEAMKAQAAADADADAAPGSQGELFLDGDNASLSSEDAAPEPAQDGSAQDGSAPHAPAVEAEDSEAEHSEHSEEDVEYEYVDEDGNPVVVSEDDGSAYEYVQEQETAQPGEGASSNRT